MKNFLKHLIFTGIFAFLLTLCSIGLVGVTTNGFDYLVKITDFQMEAPPSLPGIDQSRLRGVVIKGTLKAHWEPGWIIRFLGYQAKDEVYTVISDGTTDKVYLDGVLVDELTTEVLMLGALEFTLTQLEDELKELDLEQQDSSPNNERKPKYLPNEEYY